jgi:hypothetical protein
MLPSHVYLVFVSGDKTHKVFTNLTLATSWMEQVDGTIIPYVIKQPERVLTDE